MCLGIGSEQEEEPRQYQGNDGWPYLELEMSFIGTARSFAVLLPVAMASGTWGQLGYEQEGFRCVLKKRRGQRAVCAKYWVGHFRCSL